MPQQLAIDGLRFSERRERLEGSIALADFPRLTSGLESTEGALAFVLQGEMGTRGEHLLSLVLDGVLQLCCQRCLKPVEVPLRVDVTYELKDELAELPTQEELEDDSRDFLLASRSMDLIALIEDEVLLAMPAAPRHSECSLPEAHCNPETASPFGALLGIKGSSSGKTH
jgi:uncharacterized protein